MATTMTTVDNMLKEIYEDRLRDQLQSEIKTLARIEKTSEGVTHEVGGKYVRFPVRTRRNHGMGARLENEALPVARQQGYADARVRLKYLYGALQLTGQVFELASKDPQSFASALSQEVDGLKEGLKKDFNRQVYGTNTGILAVAVTGSTSTLVNTGASALQYVEIGMVVSVIDSDGSTVNTATAYVMDVDLSTGTVTLSSDPDTQTALGTAVAVNDFLVRKDSLGKEVTGFEQIISETGEVYNIDPANEPVWAAHEEGSVGALSEGAMIAMNDEVHTSGGKVSAIFCSRGVRRAYFNLLSQFRQTVNTTKFTGGFSGLAFTTDDGDIPVVHDFDCQPGTMYFVNEKEIKLYEASDWSFMNRDGSNWQRVVTSAGSFDAYQAMMFKYCEIGTHRRNSHGVLTGITEPSV